MIRRTLHVAFGAALLLGPTACRQQEEIRPITLTGTWDLVRSGGGVTGTVYDVAPGTELLSFAADGTYTRASRQGAAETNAFRYQANPGPPARYLLFMTTTNTPTRAPIDAEYTIITLTSTRLELVNGTLSRAYERR